MGVGWGGISYLELLPFDFSSLVLFISKLLFILISIFTMADVMSLFSLSGKTAIVTGGTRGIGQAMAFALAEAGADIILVQVCHLEIHGKACVNLLIERHHQHINQGRDH